MKKPTKLAVLGAGLIGRRHIDHVQQVPEAELTAIVDPSAAGQEIALDKSVAWFPDLGALLAQQKPDGIIAATPTQLHVANGLEAIAAGIPILLEKPIADDVASAEVLVAAAEKSGIALLIGHHRRHNPMIQRAKAIIDSGTLGRIVSVHGFFWLTKPDDYFEIQWRREKGAGPVLTNLIHDIDLLRYLCGDISAVHAIESNAIRGHVVEETAVLLLKFDSGALGTVNVSDTIVAPWSWEQTTGENKAYPQTDQACYYIGGTLGSLSIPKLEVWTNDNRPSWLEPLRAERLYAVDLDPLRLQIQHFCRVIRGEEEPLVSGRERLNTLKVIEAAKAAARSGHLTMIG